MKNLPLLVSSSFTQTVRYKEARLNISIASITPFGPRDINANMSPDLLNLPAELLDMICGHVSLVITLPYSWRGTYSKLSFSTVFVRTSNPALILPRQLPLLTIAVAHTPHRFESVMPSVSTHFIHRHSSFVSARQSAVGPYRSKLGTYFLLCERSL